MSTTTSSPEKVRIPKGVWKVATLAGMASYLDAGAIVTNGGALVLYKGLGVTDQQISQLSAILTFMFAFGALFGGRLGDRFGRRKVFTVTMVGLCLGTAIMAAAPNVGLLYLGIPLLGFAIGADLPVSMAMISEEAPTGAKGKLVAFSHVLWMLAIATVMLLQVFVGDLGVTGGRIMWLHLTIVALVVLILRSTMPESAEWQRARERAMSHETSDQGNELEVVTLRQLFSKPFVFPLIGLALFYGIVNLSANTGGQFSTLLYTEFAGLTVSQAGLVGLVGLGVGLVMSFGFMRIIDTKYRYVFFLVGGIIYTLAQALPLIFGVHAWSLVGWSVLSAVGGMFAGEPMWKIWSQELFPTLLRSTSQGFTTFFTRILAALMALVTASLMAAGSAVLFAILTAAVAFTTLLGWFWLRRMPKGEDVEAALAAGATPDQAFVLK